MDRKPLTVIGVVIGVLLLAELCALLFMTFSVTRYERYWKDRATVTPSGSGKPFVYVAFGDSTAQGIGATAASKGYVGLLADEIGRTTGRPVRVINYSKTGATVTDVLDRQLPAFKAAKLSPDLVTMEIGANDLTKFDADEFESNYEQVLEQFELMPPMRIVISDMPYFGGRVKVHGNDVAASQTIRQLAEGANIPVAPLYDNLKKHNSPLIYSADLFHPSNYGYTVWRDAFWSKIEPLL